MARTDSKAAIAELRTWAVSRIQVCRATERLCLAHPAGVVADLHLATATERRTLQAVLRILNGVPNAIADDASDPD